MSLKVGDEFYTEAQMKALEQKKELFKRTFCKGLTDDEFELFRHVCDCTGLTPATKQIYAVKRGGTMTIQTGIDGLRSIAERTGNYAPGKEPTYTYDKEGKILSSTAYIKKRTNDGVWHEVSATAFYSEYSVAGTFWNKMPHLMLAKCAEALAIRKAFPAITANLYTDDEMVQAGPGNKVVAQKEEEQLEIITDETPLQRLKRILDTDGIDSSKLEEWIKHSASEKKKEPTFVIDSCLNPKFHDTFKLRYHQWFQDTISA